MKKNFILIEENEFYKLYEMVKEISYTHNRTDFLFADFIDLEYRNK